MRDRLWNILTLGVLAAAFYLAYPAVKVRVMGSASKTEPAVAVVGHKLDAIWLADTSGSTRQIMFSSDGKQTTVLYLFMTSCRYCEQQKMRVAEAMVSFSRFKGVRVVAVSPESPRDIADYWIPTGMDLPSPTTIMPWSIQDIGGTQVPSIYVISPEGEIKKAVPGLLAESVLQDIRDLLESPNSAGPVRPLGN